VTASSKLMRTGPDTMDRLAGLRGFDASSPSTSRVASLNASGAAEPAGSAPVASASAWRRGLLPRTRSTTRTRRSDQRTPCAVTVPRTELPLYTWSRSSKRSAGPNGERSASCASSRNRSGAWPWRSAGGGPTGSPGTRSGSCSDGQPDCRGRGSGRGHPEQKQGPVRQGGRL
jgi:hypothetical protein